MAKDPAFLFYPGDWLGGTMLLTRHQKGCYIDLLMAQFNYGPLSLDQIKIVLGQDQASWTVLQEKFKRDNNGRFFNEKLATEIEKRKSYIKSRVNNKSGRKKSYEKSYENHMNLHMENENENEDVNENEEIGGAGENELNFIVPKMQKLWIENFPNYTQNKKFDYESLGAILGFMFSQSGNHDPTDKNTQEMALNTLQAIADEVKKDIFWVNKPLKSIANNIQEFYNKIKNPQNAGRGKKDKPTADSLQQALNRRFQQQDGGGEPVVADAYKRTG